MRYAEGKEGKSRSCKFICAAVFASLAKDNIQAFDEITVQKWDVMVGEARAKVESKPLAVNSEWRNPDVAESAKGFKVKNLRSDSQPS